MGETAKSQEHIQTESTEDATWVGNALVLATMGPLTLILVGILTTETDRQSLRKVVIAFMSAAIALLAWSIALQAKIRWTGRHTKPISYWEIFKFIVLVGIIAFFVWFTVLANSVTLI